MAIQQQPQLLDCGHVDVAAGVCQYNGHAISLCRDCLITCDRCGRCLCQRHQRWTEWIDQTRIFCPDHITSYYLQYYLRRFLWGGRGD